MLSKEARDTTNVAYDLKLFHHKKALGGNGFSYFPPYMGVDGLMWLAVFRNSNRCRSSSLVLLDPWTTVTMKYFEIETKTSMSLQNTQDVLQILLFSDEPRRRRRR